MSDCLFCKIADGTIPTQFVYSDGNLVAFPDINPQAPTHVLIVPRQHLPSAAHLDAAHDDLWAQLLHAAQKIARDNDIEGNGYRLVVNVGSDGGQTVEHLHIHLLGGRHMAWPPG